MKPEDEPPQDQRCAPSACNASESSPPTAGAVPRKVVLGASCTIEDVAQVRSELINHLSASTPIIIDASRLERIDTAGVQLLAAFAIDCLEQGIAFAWKERPAALEEAIRLLGLGALMESPCAVFEAEGAS
jgi:anti-anti-sigma regulatory factor